MVDYNILEKSPRGKNNNNYNLSKRFIEKNTNINSFDISNKFEINEFETKEKSYSKINKMLSYTEEKNIKKLIPRNILAPIKRKSINLPIHIGNSGIFSKIDYKIKSPKNDYKSSDFVDNTTNFLNKSSIFISSKKNNLRYEINKSFDLENNTNQENLIDNNVTLEKTNDLILENIFRKNVKIQEKEKLKTMKNLENSKDISNNNLNKEKNHNKLDKQIFKNKHITDRGCLIHYNSEKNLKIETISKNQIYTKVNNNNIIQNKNVFLTPKNKKSQNFFYKKQENSLNKNFNYSKYTEYDINNIIFPIVNSNINKSSNYEVKIDDFNSTQVIEKVDNIPNIKISIDQKKLNEDNLFYKKKNKGYENIENFKSKINSILNTKKINFCSSPIDRSKNFEKNKYKKINSNKIINNFSLEETEKNLIYEPSNLTHKYNTNNNLEEEKNKNLKNSKIISKIKLNLDAIKDYQINSSFRKSAKTLNLPTSKNNENNNNKNLDDNKYKINVIQVSSKRNADNLNDFPHQNHDMSTAALDKSDIELKKSIEEKNKDYLKSFNNLSNNIVGNNLIDPISITSNKSISIKNHSKNLLENSFDSNVNNSPNNITIIRKQNVLEIKNIEETHFTFVYISQSSKKLTKFEDNINFKDDNFYSTVIDVNEVDID